jgi:SAM-dependent methyltransferase
MGDYYQENWKAYHEATFAIDPSSFLAPLFERLDPPATILDVGCGSGRDMLWFRERGFQVTGLERSSRLAELAREHSGCRVNEGDFEVYDFSSLSVDAVVLVGALVHIPNDRFQAALENVLRGLKQGGHALITLKEGRNQSEMFAGRIFHLWQDEGLRDKFEELKLTIVDFSRQVSKIRGTDVWLGYVLQKNDRNG